MRIPLSEIYCSNVNAMITYVIELCIFGQPMQYSNKEGNVICYFDVKRFSNLNKYANALHCNTLTITK